MHCCSACAADVLPLLLLLVQAAAGGLSYVDSQANPICSPSTSAFFSARDERSGWCSAGGSLQDEYSQAASMATCESSSTLVRLELHTS